MPKYFIISWKALKLFIHQLYSNSGYTLIKPDIHTKKMETIELISIFKIYFIEILMKQSFFH